MARTKKRWTSVAQIYESILGTTNWQSSGRTYESQRRTYFIEKERWENEQDRTAAKRIRTQTTRKEKMQRAADLAARKKALGDEAKARKKDLAKTARKEKMQRAADLAARKKALGDEAKARKKDIAQEKDLKRKAAIDAEQQRQAERTATIRAQAAAYKAKGRELARTLKRMIRSDHPCPYCNGPLGKNWHADHIIPHSRGGLSEERNLVAVCAPCNQQKGASTISKFCGGDLVMRARVERNLAALRKEF